MSLDPGDNTSGSLSEISHNGHVLDSVNNLLALDVRYKSLEQYLPVDTENMTTIRNNSLGSQDLSTP